MATTDGKFVWIAKIVLWAASKLGTSEIKHLEFPQLFFLVDQVVYGLALLRLALNGGCGVFSIYV
jgi:hypothetical protein